MDSCTKYGIMSGCDKDCPVLNEKNCRNFEEIYYSTLILDNDISEDELRELYNLYFPKKPDYLKIKVRKLKRLLKK